MPKKPRSKSPFEMVVEEVRTCFCKMLDPYGLTWEVRSRTKSGIAYTVDFRDPAHGCQCTWHTSSVGPDLKRDIEPKKYCFHWNVAEEAAKSHWRKVMVGLDKKFNLIGQGI